MRLHQSKLTLTHTITIPFLYQRSIVQVGFVHPRRITIAFPKDFERSVHPAITCPLPDLMYVNLSTSKSSSARSPTQLSFGNKSSSKSTQLISLILSRSIGRSGNSRTSFTFDTYTTGKLGRDYLLFPISLRDPRTFNQPERSVPHTCQFPSVPFLHAIQNSQTCEPLNISSRSRS